MEHSADEPVVEIFTCEDEVEKALVEEALNEAGIPFTFVAVPDRSWEGVVDEVEAHGVICVLEHHADEAMEVIQSALPGETEIVEYEDDVEELDEETEK
jgi:hypothetical protein